MLTVFKVAPEEFPAQDNLFQTAYWGRFKTACGQRAVFFLCEYEYIYSETTIKAKFPFMVLIRTASYGLYGYAPKAPSVKIPECEYGILLENLALAVKQYLPPETVCIRFDTIWKSPYKNSFSNLYDTPRNDIRELRMNFGTENRNLRKTKREHFCPDTVIIDLQNSPEMILQKMRQTTRNCIRRAYKEEVLFSEKTIDFLPEWHKLYKNTASRKKFFAENLEYFIKLLGRPDGPGRIFFKQLASPHEDCGKGPPAIKSKKNSIMGANPNSMPVTALVPEPSFHILAAEKNNNLLSCLILAICGKTAYYMYSGSEPEYNNFMAGYGLQWEAILTARRSGCTQYDLLGIPPNNNPAYFMSSLYTFKTGFGGEVAHCCGCWDFPYDNDKYTYFSNGEEFQEAAI